MCAVAVVKKNMAFIASKANFMPTDFETLIASLNDSCDPLDFRFGLLALLQAAMDCGMLNSEQAGQVARIRSRIEIELKNW